MFIFGTSDEPPLDPYRTKIGTGDGQALVSKDKHIKTGINNINLSKQKNNKKKSFENLNKQDPTVPYQDNLKTSSDKNYHEPLWNI